MDNLESIKPIKCAALASTMNWEYQKLIQTGGIHYPAMKASHLAMVYAESVRELNTINETVYAKYRATD